MEVLDRKIYRSQVDECSILKANEDFWDFYLLMLYNMRNTTTPTNTPIRGIPEVLSGTPPLVAFYGWLLETSERKREMNNILALFEDRGGELYIKGSENTLEGIFLSHKRDRKHKTIADYAIMMDVFHDLFRSYYQTNSLIKHEGGLAREIEIAIPPVKRFLEDAVSRKGVTWIQESVDDIINKMTSR